MTSKHILGRVTNMQFTNNDTGEVTQIPDGVLSRTDEGMLRVDCDDGHWVEFKEGELPTMH